MRQVRKIKKDTMIQKVMETKDAERQLIMKLYNNSKSLRESSQIVERAHSKIQSIVDRNST